MKRAKRLYWVRIAHLTLTELIGRTIRRRAPEIAANVTRSNALLRRLTEHMERYAPTQI